MPNLTLHHLQVSQSERIGFLLEELNLPYEAKLYKRSPLLSPPELKGKHPLGASPVLEDSTDTSSPPILLAESGAIAEYLIYKYADGRLAVAPQDPKYATYLYWFHFANATLQPAMFRMAMTRGMVSTTDPRYAANEKRVKTAVAHVNQQLESNDYLAGDEFTAADVMTMWCFSTMRTFEPLDLTEYAGIRAWLERVAARPAYQRAMQKCDPELDIKAGISAKGPAAMEMFAKAMALRL